MCRTIFLCDIVVSPKYDNGREGRPRHQAHYRNHRQVIAEVEGLTPDLAHQQADGHDHRAEEAKNSHEHDSFLYVGVHDERLLP